MISTGITKARDFTQSHDYDASAIVRLNNTQVAKLGGRHSWVKLSGGAKTLMRRVRGSGGISGLSNDAMEIDYDSRLELGIDDPRSSDEFYTCSIVITPASFVDKIKAHWFHPNIEYQVPFRLAMIGLALGIVGLFLGLMSLAK